MKRDESEVVILVTKFNFFRSISMSRVAIPLLVGLAFCKIFPVSSKATDKGTMMDVIVLQNYL